LYEPAAAGGVKVQEEEVDAQLLALGPDQVKLAAGGNAPQLACSVTGSPTPVLAGVAASVQDKVVGRTVTVTLAGVNICEGSGGTLCAVTEIVFGPTGPASVTLQVVDEVEQGGVPG
jgi:hypothetical protein